MALWPNNRADITGWQPTRLWTYAWFNQHASPWSQRQTAVFTTLPKTSSVGQTPSVAILHPLTAGGMSARAESSISTTGNMLQGGPMQMAATATMTMNTAGMSLTVGMSAPWTGAYTPTASLRLTVGMSATYTAVFTGTSNLAMIVPLGSTTFTAAFTGSADLKGNLSMTAEFGGAEPLSPEGLARAVWEALATEYNTAGTMGEKLNLAGTGGVDLNALAAAILAAAQANPIHADVRKVNGYTVTGEGTSGNPWGPS